MIRLKDCVEIVTAPTNDNCVILKVKENAEMDMISIGCFDGNEVMFRMTRDDDCNDYTIWHKNGNTCTWNDRTLISNNLKSITKELKRCIVKDFGFNMGKHMEFLKREGHLD